MSSVFDIVSRYETGALNSPCFKQIEKESKAGNIRGGNIIFRVYTNKYARTCISFREFVVGNGYFWKDSIKYHIQLRVFQVIRARFQRTWPMLHI